MCAFTHVYTIVTNSRAAVQHSTTQVRTTILSRSSALVELDAESQAQLLCSEFPSGAMGGGVTAVQYSEYAAERYAKFASEASPVTPAGDKAGDRGGDRSGDPRAAKRQRVAQPGAGDAEAVDGGAAGSGSSCVIM
jgi:hypothetical protein